MPTGHHSHQSGTRLSSVLRGGSFFLIVHTEKRWLPLKTLLPSPSMQDRIVHPNNDPSSDRVPC